MAMKVRGPATAEDLMNMPDDGHKYELVDGYIVVSPGGMRSSEIALHIGRIIGNYLEEHPIGRVYTADAGIELPNENVRAPDVTYVSIEKLPQGRSPVTFGSLVPDLVVEVLSPSEQDEGDGREDR